MKEVDWIIHMVIDQPGPGNSHNSHTHGMEKYSHEDFQIVLPYGREETCRLLNTFGRRVQNGERFADGDMVMGIYEDCPIRLKRVRETSRYVLQLIVPDRNNRFPEDPLCSKDYINQLFSMFEF